MMAGSSPAMDFPDRALYSRMIFPETRTMAGSSPAMEFPDHAQGKSPLHWHEAGLKVVVLPSVFRRLLLSPSPSDISRIISPRTFNPSAEIPHQCAFQATHLMEGLHMLGFPSQQAYSWTVRWSDSGPRSRACGSVAPTRQLATVLFYLAESEIWPLVALFVSHGAPGDK